jgi:hypothetical protein
VIQANTFAAAAEEVVVSVGSSQSVGPSVPILVMARATPLAATRVRAMVATINMVRLIIYPSSFCVCDL